MARENKDRAYLFTGAWEEIENRFGLAHPTSARIGCTVGESETTRWYDGIRRGFEDHLRTSP